MKDLQRYQDIVVLGVQSKLNGGPFVLCNDPETGTTFAVHPGETIGQALDRVESRFREAVARR
jgi:hypothetical protein